jgi:two-component system NtrC family sensor kinase
MVLLSLLSILIAAVVSRKLVKPLWQLGSVTTDLPSKLLDQQAIAWPSSSVREIDSLVLNFKSMGSVLSRQFIEIKAAQARIAQQEKMASIGQLAAGVAHEINNPIGFIMSNLTSLRKYLARLSEFIEAQSQAIRRLSTEAVRQDEVAKEVEESRRSLKIDYVMDDMHALVTESLDGAGRVKKIVQDFKSFTHVDQAGFKPADINECLESTINIVWNELKNKAEVKKDYGDLPQTKCNPGQLNQAFMNLLVNAAHAIEMRGEIAIRTREENGSISVSISDTGCGIPADRMSRIFEPFFTTKEVGKGTGLGLSIAYDIVKKHSGSIDVRSSVGKGTTFTVTIPVVAG